MQPIYKQDWSPSVSDLIYTRVPLVKKAVTTTNAQAAAQASGESISVLPLESKKDQAQAPSPPSEPYIINLGIVDKYIREQYGRVRVLDVKLGVQELSQQLLVHCCTARYASPIISPFEFIVISQYYLHPP
ncbi:hypothetical protein BDV06DRAFT_224060 [Aspergillus oleicola]